MLLRLFVVPPILHGIQFSKAYFDRDGRLMRLALTLDDKYRVFTPLSEISSDIQNATLLYEDDWFYFHPGINPVSLVRATFSLVGNGRKVGASTVTMQVARMIYDLDTKSWDGKLKQIMLALYLDLFHSKNEILEAYLNLAPYGGNIEGIGAASIIYFGKKAAELSKLESITIATIPQNPNKRSLLTKSGLANMSNMRLSLAQKWVERHPGDENIKTLAAMPITAGTKSALPFMTPHFTDRLLKKMRYRNPNDYKVSTTMTTIDLKLQKRLEDAMVAHLSDKSELGISNAAAILLNFKTMEVMAYIGSNDYFNKNISGQVDGVAMRRSPGSLLKSFIYALAIEDGLIHPMSLLKDARISFGVYTPENTDSEFYGPILATDALTRSRNIPAISLLNTIGLDRFRNFLESGGVMNLLDANYYGVSLAIGGAETTMTEVAQLYAMLANLGELRPIKITRDDTGAPGKRILSKEAAFLALDMLGASKTPHTSTLFAKRQSKKLRHHYKTGTSSSFRDAWTAGIFGDFVLVVWIGNFDGTPNNHFTGGGAATPLYFTLASKVNDYYPNMTDNKFIDLDMNISRVEMCANVGGLPGRFCPKTTMSYFIPGKSPISVSTVHRRVAINNTTGLRSCSYSPARDRLEVFEFWEPEYANMFARAGIVKKTPPPFEANCEIDDIESSYHAPVIISPAAKTKVVADKNGMVVLKALGPTLNSELFWFLNEKFIGTTKNDEVMMYSIPAGNHIIRVTDQFGHSAEADFGVTGK